MVADITVLAELSKRAVRRSNNIKVGARRSISETQDASYLRKGDEEIPMLSYQSPYTPFKLHKLKKSHSLPT